MIAQSNQLSKPYDWRYAVFALVLVIVLSWLYITLNAIKQTGLLLFQRVLAGAFIAGFGKQISHMMDGDLPLAFDGYDPILG
jgi:hypothetical protein